MVNVTEKGRREVTKAPIKKTRVDLLMWESHKIILLAWRSDQTLSRFFMEDVTHFQSIICAPVCGYATVSFAELDVHPHV